MSNGNRSALPDALRLPAALMKLVLVLAFFVFMPLSAITTAQAKDLAFTEKEVHFYSGPGLKLVGFLSIPSGCGEKSRCPGIVMAHGPGGYKRPEVARKDTLMPGASNWLSKSGFVTLRFSYRGVAESEGPAYRMIPLEQVEDIQNAITFLQQQKEVDVSRIGLFGLATGGANVSYVAGIDPRVQTVVSVNGMGDLGRWMREIRPYWAWLEFNKMLDEDRVNRVLGGSSRLLEQRDIIVNDPASQQYRASAIAKNPELAKITNLISLESAEALAKFQPESVVKNISPRAALWIAAEHDTLLPIEHSRRMYQNAGEPKKLVILEGEEHHSLYQGEGFKRMMAPANEWFMTHLMKNTKASGESVPKH